MDAIWNALDDPDSSKAGRRFAQIMPAFILFAVMFSLLQSLQPPPIDDVVAAVVDTFIDFVFLCEIVVRFVTCPNRWTFFLSAYNIIDLA
eukprot:CAMPEP_0172764520 /NCGR_PEP_ID=MMETSP1074-20121228/177411_1 /TAXON_ID=2916 /ORGANISM="Ceratium fusus, Strain PA161109" /LENGTH=89 /DNA_ID=CAMNT_0013599295 /DNA_START=50 /DNA_END=316 /DNA_ORIENTATION=+